MADGCTPGNPSRRRARRSDEPLAMVHRFIALTDTSGARAERRHAPRIVIGAGLRSRCTSSESCSMNLSALARCDVDDLEQAAGLLLQTTNSTPGFAHVCRGFQASNFEWAR